MPVETLRPSAGRLAGGPFTSAMPFRILNKGPDYFRRQADPGARKLSAVERLEADKAKYVKSQQVALTRQAPIQPPIIRKPLLSPAMMLQCRISTPPARKVPRRPADTENGGGGGGGGPGGEGGGRRGPHLNLEILNNLINNVCEAPLSTSPSTSASSPSSGAKSIGSSLSAEQERSARHLLLDHLKPGNRTATTTSSSTSSCTSSSLLNAARSQAPPPPELPSRRPPPVPARGLRVAPPPAPYGSPNSVTVRRVDVRPQVEVRKPQRPQLKPKPQLQPHVKPRQTAQPQAPPPPPPQTPTKALPPTPLPYLPPSPMLFRAGMMPPASPAFTRLSSASSRGSRAGSARKHPSLHRSKSDLSDRYSRATADLERFFNYCGLDPQEVEGLGGVERFARAASDIVSVSKLRSVSTPSSEYGEQQAAPGGVEQQQGEEEGGANERIPYGISVIERNARVIKWLYGIRQARDTSGVSNV